MRRVASNLGVRPKSLPIPDTRILGVYLDFFARVLDFSVFPHFSRHPRAAPVGLNGKKRAWGRVREQVRKGVRNPKWFREDSGDKIGIIFARLFDRIGGCILPVHIAPPMAEGLLELWQSAPERRIQVK